MGKIEQPPEREMNLDAHMIGDVPFDGRLISLQLFSAILCLLRAEAVGRIDVSILPELIDFRLCQDVRHGVATLSFDPH